ncbi:MAG: zinc dependent phospholipase C family protein [Lachnospiraceae bacterium]|nr:zinc dependent phospholipase C family protein [Lachnospiraceae bacterium]
MPAIFAHDLYGRNVFMDSSKEIRDVIRKEKDCFYLGVQGPDVLFFYRPWGKNPINQKGYRYHERPAAEIFAHGLEVMRNTKDQDEKAAIQAYLLGFACHYALDHSLHGDINQLEEQTGFTHAEIETELDRRLLTEASMDPVRAYTACHLKNTKWTRFVVMKVLKEGEAQAKEAIISFKLITRLFINTGERFKRFLGVVMKAIGCHDKYYGMVMKQEPLEGLEETTDHLEEMFVSAVPFGVKLVEGLYGSMKKRDAIPDAFWGNFEGKMVR